jgi:hypothetical protein
LPTSRCSYFFSTPTSGPRGFASAASIERLWCDHGASCLDKLAVLHELRSHDNAREWARDNPTMPRIACVHAPFFFTCCRQFRRMKCARMRVLLLLMMACIGLDCKRGHDRVLEKARLACTEACDNAKVARACIANRAVWPYRSYCVWFEDKTAGLVHNPWRSGLWLFINKSCHCVHRDD